MNVAEFVQQKELQRLAIEERRVFRQWEEILRAKDLLEQGRRDPLAYSWYRIQGRNVIFTVEQQPEEDIIGQPRCVIKGKSYVCSGIVDDVIDKQVILYVQRGNPQDLPQKGTLTFDTFASEVALQRQWKALEATQYGRSVRSDLGVLLVHPERARHPEDIQVSEFFQSNLDDSKKQALAKALGAPDIIVVQGPPGTGKTTWITELICQFLQHNPGKKVLLSAQTHTAVDNVLEKIANLKPDLKIVRVGSTERMSEGVRRFRIEEQVQSWKEEVRCSSDEFLKKWANRQGISEALLSPAPKLEASNDVIHQHEVDSDELSGVEVQYQEYEQMSSTIENLAQQVFHIADEVDTFLRQNNVLHNVGMLKKTAESYIEVALDLVDILMSAESSLKGDNDKLLDVIEISRNKLEHLQEKEDELREQIAKTLNDDQILVTELAAAREKVESFLTAMANMVAQLAKLQRLQKEWLERFGLGRDFEAALMSVADVVAGTCVGIAGAPGFEETKFDLVILDEASQATPTEALVAMSRGKKWVLVGDQRQLPPFVDEALLKEDLMVHFDREDLQETIFTRLLNLLPQECQAALFIQHRMIPPIGDLISECFYDHQLKSARPDTSNPSISKILKRPITWYSTSKLPRRRETLYQHPGTDKPSYINLEEARRIQEWLGKLEACARQECTPLDVAVITGYSAQKELLQRELVSTDNEKWQALRIQVNTVDAFQGREADIVIYSVTRSNEQGDIGFLASSPRLNVALSRGRDALVIFGDADHCRSSGILDNPFIKVLDYIQSHPTTCVEERLL